eukprot:337068_1
MAMVKDTVVINVLLVYLRQNLKKQFNNEKTLSRYLWINGEIRIKHCHRHHQITSPQLHQYQLYNKTFNNTLSYAIQDPTTDPTFEPTFEIQQMIFDEFLLVYNELFSKPIDD